MRSGRRPRAVHVLSKVSENAELLETSWIFEAFPLGKTDEDSMADAKALA